MEKDSVFDSLDILIVNKIANNARVSFLEVARECNVSGALVHQRIQKMMRLGLIEGSCFIFDPIAIGLNTCAFVGLHIDYENYHEEINRLQQIPEIVECHSTSGRFNAFIKIYTKNNSELVKLLKDKIESSSTKVKESAISLEENFKSQLPIEMFSIS